MLSKLAPYFAALGPSLVLTMPAAAQAPDVIPSRVVKVVEFEDRARLYRVDLDSGAVTFTDSCSVQPIPPAPQPTPTPKPDPAPTPFPPIVVDKAAFFTLMVAPYDPEQRSWLDDKTIRAEMLAAGVKFRVLNSTEEDVDTLGLRQFARKNEIPSVVVQNKAGKVILSRKVTSAEDVVKALREANK